MEYCPETNLSCEGGKNSGRGTWCDHLGCLTATFMNTLVISIFMIYKYIQICGKNDADAVFYSCRKFNLGCPHPRRRTIVLYRLN